MFNYFPISRSDRIFSVQYIQWLHRVTSWRVQCWSLKIMKTLQYQIWEKFVQRNRCVLRTENLLMYSGLLDLTWRRRKGVQRSYSRDLNERLFLFKTEDTNITVSDDLFTIYKFVSSYITIQWWFYVFLIRRYKGIMKVGREKEWRKESKIDRQGQLKQLPVRWEMR